MRAMKGLKILVGLLCLIVAGVVYWRERGKPEPKVGPKSGPQYEWVNLFEDDVAIRSPEFQSVLLTNVQKVRYRVRGRYPVEVAVLSFELNNLDREQIDFNELGCHDFVNTNEFTRECNVPGHGVLYITHDGSPPALSVNLKIDAWQCTNCEAPRALRR